MINDIADCCRKMIIAMIKAKGDQFTLGYMESFLRLIIETYVTDEKELQQLKIEMLDIACEYALESLDNK